MVRSTFLALLMLRSALEAVALPLEAANITTPQSGGTQDLEVTRGFYEQQVINGVNFMRGSNVGSDYQLQIIMSENYRGASVRRVQDLKYFYIQMTNEQRSSNYVTEAYPEIPRAQWSGPDRRQPDQARSECPTFRFSQRGINMDEAFEKLDSLGLDLPWDHVIIQMLPIDPESENEGEWRPATEVYYLFYPEQEPSPGQFYCVGGTTKKVFSIIPNGPGGGEIRNLDSGLTLKGDVATALEGVAPILGNTNKTIEIV